MNIAEIAGMAELLLIASLKGSIILLLALVSVRLMRRASAAARHAVLALALGAFLILPVAQLAAPQWTLRVLPVMPGRLLDRDAADARPRGDDLAIDRALDAHDRSPAAALAPEGEGSAPLDAASPLAPRDPKGEPAAVGDARNSGWWIANWPMALAILWLVGVALVLLRYAAGIAAVRMLERRAVMIIDGGWLHAAHATAQRLGLTRGVTLLRGDRGAVPLTWGVLQPVVWLPVAAEEWNADRRTVVLAHELAHIKRRDAATQWIANLVIALHWFNPLAWMVAIRLRVERERACDDAVLTLGTQPTVYAEHLLDMVRAMGHRGAPAAAMAMARPSQFEGRLLAILDGSAERRGIGALRLAALGVAALLLAFPLAGMTPAARATLEQPRPVADAGGYPAALNEAEQEIADRWDVPHSTPLMSEGSRVAVERVLTGSSTSDSLLRRAEVSGDSLLVLEIIAVAAQMSSSAEQARILRRIAAMEGLDGAAVVALLAAAKGMSSSAGKVSVISLVIDRHRDLALAAGAPLVQAIGSISGSEDRSRLLARVIASPAADERLTRAMLEVTSQIPGSLDRVRVMRAMVRHQPAALGEAATEFFTVLDQIPSSAERASLLREIVTRPQLSGAVLIRAFESTALVPASAAQASVLVAAARARPITGDVRTAYLRTASLISSGSERSRALSALLPGSDDEPGNSKGLSSSPSSGSIESADVVEGLGRRIRLAWHRASVAPGEMPQLAPRGLLELEETRDLAGERAGSVTRRVIMTADAGGRVTVDYCIDDVSRPFDEEGRAWLRAMLAEHRATDH